MSKICTMKNPGMIFLLIGLLVLSVLVCGCGNESSDNKKDALAYYKQVYDAIKSDQQIAEKFSKTATDFENKKLSLADFQSVLKSCKQSTADNSSRIKKLAIPSSFDKGQQEVTQNLVKTYAVTSDAMVVVLEKSMEFCPLPSLTAVQNQELDKAVEVKQKTADVFVESLKKYQETFKFTQEDLASIGITSK